MIGSRQAACAAAPWPLSAAGPARASVRRDGRRSRRPGAASALASDAHPGRHPAGRWPRGRISRQSSALDPSRSGWAKS